VKRRWLGVLLAGLFVVGLASPASAHSLRSHCQEHNLPVDCDRVQTSIPRTRSPAPGRDRAARGSRDRPRPHDVVYAPHRHGSRQEMATFIVRAFEYATDRSLPEPDVAITDISGSHTANIRELVGLGVTVGVPDTEYARRSRSSAARWRASSPASSTAWRSRATARADRTTARLLWQLGSLPYAHCPRPVVRSRPFQIPREVVVHSRRVVPLRSAPCR
jgi:hypothetical protein